MTSHRLRQLRCPHCQQRSPCGPEEMLQSLRAAGMLRREAKPDRSVLLELMNHHVASLSCESCGQSGLVLEEFEDDFDDGISRLCELCQRAIPAERLQVLPQATRCAACADRPDEVAADFCPRCGAILAVRQASGPGLARYRSVCSECGYRQ